MQCRPIADRRERQFGRPTSVAITGSCRLSELLVSDRAHAHCSPDRCNGDEESRDVNHSSVRHRLLAILAADAVGFSRLMTADDRSTVASLDAARAVFLEQVESHAGRVIDMAGDSVLAVFEAAAAAVNAALSIQLRLASLHEDLP